MKVLVSACLLGTPCRYDGQSHPNQQIMQLVEGQEVVAVCPEVAGGLPVPRLRCELDESCRQLKVLQEDGADMTEAFLEGARKTVAQAQQEACSLAILTSKSPSCGSDYIYDGTFTKTLVPGVGVTCAQLRDAGVRVISEERAYSCSAALFATNAQDTPTLSTRRLRLTSNFHADAEEIFNNYASDAEVGLDAGWEPHRTLEDTLKFIASDAMAPHTFGIHERDSGHNIGFVVLVPDTMRSNPDCMRLDFALSREHWGKGYATEACRELVRYGFMDLGLSLISAKRYLFNVRAGRVLEKCGFVEEGTLRSAFVAPEGNVRDVVVYSMSREEFLSQSASNGSNDNATTAGV